MDRELNTDNKQNEEIDSLIEKLSGSAIEFRNTASAIIFKRLRRLLQTKQKQITRESRLKEIFSHNVSEEDWDELKIIGLKIPVLQRAKMFNYLLVIYLIVAFGVLFIFSILNWNLVFAVGDSQFLALYYH